MSSAWAASWLPVIITLVLLACVVVAIWGFWPSRKKEPRGFEVIQRTGEPPVLREGGEREKV